MRVVCHRSTCDVCDAGYCGHQRGTKDTDREHLANECSFVTRYSTQSGSFPLLNVKRAVRQPVIIMLRANLLAKMPMPLSALINASAARSRATALEIATKW